MSRYLHRYGIDPTGVNRSNLVQNEVRTLVRKDRRALVPKYGAFFSESLKVRDKATNQVLKVGTHYTVSRLYDEPTAEFGKEIYGLIVIIDPRVSDTVVIEYQAVGGKYEDSLPIILELISAVKNDHRGALYGSVSGKPSGFKPVRHLHDIGDIYGFEPLVHSIERTRMAMELSGALDHDHYYTYLDRLLLSMANLGSLLASEVINNHAVDITAHAPYILRTRAEASAIIVRRPTIVKPVNNATKVARNPVFELSPYLCMYRNPQRSMQVQVSRRADFSVALDVNASLPGPFSTYQYPSTLLANTGYYWRARYQADDSSFSDWSPVGYFTTGLS